MEKYRRIEFQAATKASTASIGSNFGNNNKDKSKNVVNGSNNVNTLNKENARVSLSEGLFPEATVVQNAKWKEITQPGPGLFNHGNTCFMNSALQCLIHTPALAQILANKNHEIDDLLRGSNNQRFSVLLLLRSIVNNAWQSNGSHGPRKNAISAKGLVQNIRCIGKHFRPGRQEDSHEFIRLLLDNIHEAILKMKGVKLSDHGGKLADTTLIGRIFGGYLKNELRCFKCDYRSQTFNHFLDLSLEIGKGVNSVKDAIKMFTKAEKLDRGNEWFCEKCKAKVPASKQLVISQPPAVLMIHLKRFNYNGKINKHINFSLTEMIPCVLDNKSSKVTDIKYHLYGIIVHHGFSTHSGHYVAYIKAPSGQWCEMNDTQVSRCNSNQLLSQEAYVLFYTKECTEPLPSGNSSTSVDESDSAAVRRAMAEKVVQMNKNSAAAPSIANGVTEELGEVVDKRTAKALRKEAAAAAKIMATGAVEVSAVAADMELPVSNTTKRIRDNISSETDSAGVSDGLKKAKLQKIDSNSVSGKNSNDSDSDSDSDSIVSDSGSTGTTSSGEFFRSQTVSSAGMNGVQVKPICSWQVKPVTFLGPVQSKFFRHIINRVNPSSRCKRNFKLQCDVRAAMLARSMGMAVAGEMPTAADNDGDSDRDSDSDSDSDNDEDKQKLRGQYLALLGRTLEDPALSDSSSDSEDEASADSVAQSDESGGSGSESESEPESGSESESEKGSNSLFTNVPAAAAAVTTPSVAVLPRTSVSRKQGSETVINHFHTAANTDTATTNNTGAMKEVKDVDAAAFKSSLIADARRGRDVGTEGYWDKDTAAVKAVVAEKEKITKGLIKQEREFSRKHQVDQWDTLLDQGRIKKVKLGGGEKDETGDQTNYFQAIASSQISDKEMGIRDHSQQHMSYVNQNKAGASPASGKSSFQRPDRDGYVHTKSQGQSGRGGGRGQGGRGGGRGQGGRGGGRGQGGRGGGRGQGGRGGGRGQGGRGGDKQRWK